MVRSSNALFIMFMISFLWGSSYVFTKGLTNQLSPLWSFFLSTVLGSLIFFVFFSRKLKGFPWKRIGILVLINFFVVSNAILNVVGLSYTTSTNASFIIQMSVLLIPIFSAIATRTHLKPTIVLCSLVALAGVAVLMLDFSNLTVNPGDIIILIVSASFSIYVVMLSVKGEGLRIYDVLTVYYAMSIPVGLVTILLFERNLPAIPVNDAVFLMNLILGSMVILSAQILQVSISRVLRPETIALICCFEPIVTAFLAFFMLAEEFTPKMLIGCLIIMVALLLSNVFQRLENCKHTKFVKSQQNQP